jgi:hypothetical protein
MTSQVFLADVGFGLGDQANELSSIQDTYQSRANQITGNC